MEGRLKCSCRHLHDCLKMFAILSFLSFFFCFCSCSRTDETNYKKVFLHLF
ncbi:hypothetical protein NC653_009065 [Populus alba x Populus x berolinensis]|uniref:Uncharacterized protein n=1 Tax=Populus alba x Populus x berolinensis TaxID=444605 RepID=A0AAD6R8D1_9ROSI|nr:hypothetical protein NC653_009065 [Populus alba x Populus x berolinensis]